MRIRHHLNPIAAALVLLAVSLVGPGRVEPASRPPQASVFYLSVGTSLAVGFQPNPAGKGHRTQEGYADRLREALTAAVPKLRLVKLGCPGETTATMIAGGVCGYRQGSQLAEAEAFLQDHRGAVALVTLDMGANDIEPCGTLAGIDQLCVARAVASVAANLPVIVARLRAAAGPDVPIVAMNYYNPFLAAWFVDPALAATSAAGLAAFNGLLGLIYSGFAVPVADVATAFAAVDFTPVPEAGGIPRNVLLVCLWTWMCAPAPVGPNIHANEDGYAVLAGAFLAVLAP
jgi:lysophospholipase L1-like esterase